MRERAESKKLTRVLGRDAGAQVLRDLVAEVQVPESCDEAADAHRASANASENVSARELPSIENVPEEGRAIGD